MQVTERVVSTVAAAPPADLAWFAARQPGVVRYLEVRCGAGSDALCVAVVAAQTIHSAFEAALGVPPPRVRSQRCERAEAAVVAESEMGMPAGGGLAARQPALAEYVAAIAENPPLPLDRDEAERVALALAAVVYALDEASSGRPVE